MASVPSGRLAADGNVVVPLEGETLRARRRMMFAGSAVATVVVDRDGALVAAPQVTLQGIPTDGLADDLGETVALAIEDAIGELPRPRRRDDAEVREAARRAVRRTLQALRGKKPPTEVHVVRID